MSKKSIFLKYNEVMGPCLVTGFDNEIGLNTVDWGVFRPTDASHSSDEGLIRFGGKVHPTHFAFTKMADCTSTVFYKEATVGTAAKCTVSIAESVNNATMAVRTLGLDTVLITRYAVTIQGNVPVESMGCQYDSLMDTVNSYSSKGKVTASKVFGYDVVSGEKL